MEKLFFYGVVCNPFAWPYIAAAAAAGPAVALVGGAQMAIGLAAIAAVSGPARH